MGLNFQGPKGEKVQYKWKIDCIYDFLTFDHKKTTEQSI